MPQGGLRGGVVSYTTNAMEPHIRLRSWLEAANLSQAELARRCGYDRANLHKVLKGTIRPSLDMAFRLESATGGVIPASAWVQQDVAA